MRLGPQKSLVRAINFCESLMIDKIEELIVAIGKKCFDDSSSVGKKIANISI